MASGESIQDISPPAAGLARFQLGAFAPGFIFGLGLLLGGMTDPARVLGFLNVTQHWDPTLAFVMIGAIGVHLPLRYLLIRVGRVDPKAHARRGIDRSLVVGALLFGIGWGIAGYCPGPAVASLASLEASAWTFLASMGAGMWAFHWMSRAIPRYRTRSRVG